MRSGWSGGEAGEIGIALTTHDDVGGPAPRTLASAIYSKLRKDILDGRWAPSEKLLIAPLGQRFGVSLAPIREALWRLVIDGLVTAEDQRGFRVSALSMDDLADLTRTRIELECLALRRSLARGDAVWEAGLVRAWGALQAVPRATAYDRELHGDAWAAAHGHFHAALVAACGLDWLLRLRAMLFEQSERYRRLDPGRDGGRDTPGEHKRIFEASIARDAEAAAAELGAHFERTAAAVARTYCQVGSAPAGPWAAAAAEPKDAG